VNIIFVINKIYYGKGANISRVKSKRGKRILRNKQLGGFLSPSRIFLAIVFIEFISWLLWNPTSLGTVRYLSINSFLIYMLANVFFLMGTKSLKRLTKFSLVVDYSKLKYVFVIFASLSLFAMWGFILKPFLKYGFIPFSMKVFSDLNLHVGGSIQSYFLENIGINFFILRWMLVPTFAILQELRVSKNISKMNYIFLCVIFLSTDLIYSLSVSSIMSFVEMLLVFIILFWRVRIKIFNALLFVVLLYIIFAVMVFFKRANYYGYNSFGMQSISLIGIRHLIMYFGTSLNYGFYLIDNYNTISFSKGVFGVIYAWLNIGSGRETYYSLVNSPVFAGGYTTMSGYGQLAFTCGGLLIPIALFFVGIFLGRIYNNFERNVLYRLIYPFAVMGILEFARYFYFTNTHFVSALFVGLVAVLMSNPKLRRNK